MSLDSDLHTFDAAIVGAGVVGCAPSCRLALGSALRAVGEGDVLSGASKGNSALLHRSTPRPALELQCMQAGYAGPASLRAAQPSWSRRVRSWLLTKPNGNGPGIIAQAHANGVTDVREIARAAWRARAQPHLGRAALRFVPGETSSTPGRHAAYVLQALAHGAQVRRGCEVTAHDGMMRG